MKKDNNILYFGVFFSMSILAEIYCIVEKINIIGVSIVVAIATYLLLDAIQNEKIRNKEKLESYFERRFDELEKVQKALYILIKKSSEFRDQQIEELKQETSTGIESIIDTQNKTAKIIVKYIREDMKKASSINKVSCDKIATAVYQSTEKIMEEKTKENTDSKELMKTIDSNFEKLIDHMKRSFDQNFVKEELPIIEEVTKQETEKVFDANKQLMEDEIAALIAAAEEETEESKEIQEPIEKTIEETIEEPDNDPNRQLSEEEIAAMFASLEDNNTSSEEIEQVKMPEEEISSEETKQAEVPEIDLSDPNKQLSAEEIAALFASMG